MKLLHLNQYNCPLKNLPVKLNEKLVLHTQYMEFQKPITKSHQNQFSPEHSKALLLSAVFLPNLNFHLPAVLAVEWLQNSVMVIVYCQECLFSIFTCLKSLNFFLLQTSEKNWRKQAKSNKFLKIPEKKPNAHWPKVEVWKLQSELKGSGITEYWCHQVRIQAIIQFDTQLLLLLLLIILLLEECWMEFNWQMVTRQSRWNETKTTGSLAPFFFFFFLFLLKSLKQSI